MVNYIIERKNYYPEDEYEYSEYEGVFDSYEKAEKYLYAYGFHQIDKLYKNLYNFDSSDWYSIAYIIKLGEPSSYHLKKSENL